ncbi:hypothetical protein PAXINDRAFT_10131 [Paxillus involutus ATCC 200175]|nr:hypothetical protein PAXINDRAFT_10131 [Paxillus involutus ATCC 200175]
MSSFVPFIIAARLRFCFALFNFSAGDFVSLSLCLQDFMSLASSSTWCLP